MISALTIPFAMDPAAPPISTVTEISRNDLTLLSTKGFTTLNPREQAQQQVGHEERGGGYPEEGRHEGQQLQPDRRVGNGHTCIAVPDDVAAGHRLHQFRRHVTALPGVAVPTQRIVPEQTCERQDDPEQRRGHDHEAERDPGHQEVRPVELPHLHGYSQCIVCRCY